MDVGQMQRQWIDYAKSLFLEVTPPLHAHFLFLFFYVLFSLFKLPVVDLLLGCFQFLIFFCFRKGVLGWSVSATSAAPRREQPWLCRRSRLSLLRRFWKASQRSHLCPVSTVSFHAQFCVNKPQLKMDHAFK